MAQKDGGSDDTQEYPCIVKVTDGGKSNFSTKVCIYSRTPILYLIALEFPGRLKRAQQILRGLWLIPQIGNVDPAKARQEARKGQR
jgi:hypothetical protein